MCRRRQWPRSHFIIKSLPYFSSLKVVMEPTLEKRQHNKIILRKNLYLGSIGITLTFQSKINIYFPKFKVVMGRTLFIYKTIEGITTMALRDIKGLSSE